MGGEALPQTANLDEMRSKLEAYGGEEAVFAKLGLGVEELAQTVTFSSYEGTLWEAVEPSLTPQSQRSDNAKPCPLGDTVQEAFAAGGLVEVQNKLGLFKMIDPKFDVKMSDRSIARATSIAGLKKKT